MKLISAAQWGVLVLTAVITFSAGADEVKQVHDLLNYFSATCPSQGVWTQNAYNQSLNLISVIQDIKNDPDCTSVNGALGQLQSLSERINQVALASAGGEITNLRMQESSLLLGLNETTDPDLSFDIMESLEGVEGALSTYYTNPEFNSIFALQESEGLTDFTTGTNLVLSQLANNQNCLMKHSGILTGIASLGASVASAMFAPGASLATAAGASILNSVVEFARQNHLAKQIHNLNGELANTAFQCVMESLSNQWCSAQDALGVIQLKAKSLTTASQTGGFWVGAKLLDRELPIYINWLEEVRAGSDPTNSAEADRQKNEFVRDEDVKTARSEASGIFTDGQSLFDSAPNTPLDKWNVERSLINQLMTTLGVQSVGGYSVSISQSSTPNPLFDIYPSDCAGQYLIGLDPDRWRKTPQGTCYPIDGFDPLHAAKDGANWPVDLPPFVPSLQVVSSRATAWVKAAEARVSSELNLILQPDPRSIFQDAVDVDKNGLSPRLVIQHFIDFLSTQKNSLENTKDYYIDTVNRLTAIRDQIDGVINAGTDPDNSLSRKAVVTIYGEAQLAYGTVLFNGRLVRAIKNQLNELVMTGSGINAATGAQLLAADDIITEMQKYNSTSNFAELIRDVENSQELTESALTGFTSTFNENILTTLKNYDNDQKSESGDTKYLDSKASLCLKLMAVPVWPEKIPKEMCMGVQLQPSIPGGPSSTKIEAATFQLPLKQRACLDRDYLRLSLIYQNYLTQGLK